MPTPLPSSFASAAAGNTQDPSRRGDGGAGGEWSRTRMNGATQTFRRPSVATNPSHTREGSQPASASTLTSGAYMPPHMSSNTTSSAMRNGEARYSKDQLLEMYRAQRESGSLGKNVEDYFVADWDPHMVTPPVNGAWGKRDDQKTSAGPEVCWDHGGQAEPLGLTDMSDGEKELFSASVNSPLKPPPTNASKENTASGTGGRKGSISYTQGHINNYNTSSPNAARPGVRRRETGDSVGNPMSPTGSNPRFFRDEANTSTPPPALLRRKTDFRDSKADEKVKEGGPDAASPFGSLKRSSTNPLNTAVGGPNSPWGAASASQSANFSPMGAFGAFSLGSNAAAQTPTTEKKAGFGSLRGESRFKGLLSKDSSEDIAGSARDKALGNLERLAEDEAHSRSQSPWGDALKTRASRSETNPFDEPRSGSAALGGSQDVEVPSQADLGFGAFGMTSSIPGFRELMQSHENSRNPTPSLLQGHEPTSPTNTNPYQSPHGDKTAVDADDVDTDGSDIQQPQHPGLRGLRDPGNPFGSMKRVGSGMDLPTIDRSQNSSVNANRNYPGLGSLGGLSGLGGPSAWSSGGAIGTPTRERSAFGAFADPIFGSMGGDLQSPSLSALGGGGFFSPHAGISGTASIGRSSKLGALFSGMQDDQSRPESVGMDDIMRQDPAHGLDGSASKPGSNSASQTPVSAVGSLPMNHDITGTQTPGGTVPSAQQRTMVMPDRMRWIYRDPQGNIQGPWTGLEMHDWFKAGFFSPELQIKKQEDIEFEPLAQLVRRIGNSREPFLVPQIGIPHGPEPNGPQWTGAIPTGSAQPPFPGSFPSFGTTLTAEQQNALERRKQEEQYLMARQKEHLAQQQAFMKQVHPGAPASAQPPLQHQSSAHSLHSQPSFGSIASPGAYQPSPIQAPGQGQQQPQQVPGFFDAAGPLRQSGLSGTTPGILGTDIGNQDQLAALVDRLNVGRQDPFAFGGAAFSGRQPDNFLHAQQVASMLQDRAQLQEEQEQSDKNNSDDLFAQQAREERLRQFNALRAQEGDMVRTAEGLPTHPAAVSMQLEAEAAATSSEIAAEMLASEPEMSEPALTLSQQVHKAASAQRQQQQQEQEEQAPESVWGNKLDRAMPQPFPPPPSASPLPAPAAQRNRQNVADALAAGSRSQTQTPIDAPATSVAPWAKDTHEVPKGPSLKEIQEAEARTAAQREEVAAAARRAQLLAEQERLSQAQAQVVPGLPSSANWASAGSPGLPTVTTGSAWSTKTQPTPTTTATKKTLAQIQKEEEARKQRLAAATAAAAATATPSPPASASKRYADLASKAPAPSAATAAPTVSGAWTTVGAGGKAKALPVAPLGPRSSSGTVPVAPAAVPKPRPVVATRAVTAGSVPQSNPNQAVEEFSKWAKLILGKGLNSNINVDDFVQQLLFLPAEAEIISDSVYANSQTMDGRHFAEEFIRRRKLADKGVVESVSPSVFGEQKNGGGWSEVAKKGSTASATPQTPREEEAASAAFKVVAPRKKGKR
ncbi:uncharacterized protein N7443_008645 [Penicillium atrosanguineum]|uniref:uncharacterized protein n=1 Tax=Penicillium atrosanguineum TaxID=1132637 RepID=UPI0023A0B5F8|nr:uncharacterized protein N7443_008645 [Penicillium atrosanguineum]KAJ5292692.1 hypothetical protein N7443_008645 [Penicillium atrosanguineum]